MNRDFQWGHDPECNPVAGKGAMMVVVSESRSVDRVGTKKEKDSAKGRIDPCTRASEDIFLSCVPETTNEHTIWCNWKRSSASREL